MRYVTGAPPFLLFIGGLPVTSVMALVKGATKSYRLRRFFLQLRRCPAVFPRRVSLTLLVYSCFFLKVASRERQGGTQCRCTTIIFVVECV
jgi:hypothetical protein